MAKYRIIKSKDSVCAQVWSWYWPFWETFKGYSTLDLPSDDRTLNWCREAIQKHKAGKPIDEPEWRVIE